MDSISRMIRRAVFGEADLVPTVAPHNRPRLHPESLQRVRLVLLYLADDGARCISRGVVSIVAMLVLLSD